MIFIKQEKVSNLIFIIRMLSELRAEVKEQMGKSENGMLKYEMVTGCELLVTIRLRATPTTAGQVRFRWMYFG